MDAVLQTFLRAKKEDGATLSETFVKQQEKVIESFGGITNMIEMCLTNHNAHEYIDINSQQFISFKNMPQIKNEDYSITQGTCNNVDNFPTIEICYSDNDDVNVSNTNTNTNNSNNSHQQRSHDH